MNMDDIKRLAEKPGVIPGVYNYCDRWCERCPLTSKCMNYAMHAERHKGRATPDLRNREFWDELSGVFRDTLGLLKESAARHGIDIESLDTTGVAEEEERFEGETRKHPIAKSAMAYVVMADSWLKHGAELFKEKERELNRAARLQVPGGKPQSEAVSIADAAEVVSWYHTMIYPKVMRALGQRGPEGEEDPGYPKDSDGSAKVALISIDRSIAAWGILREHFPETADAILDMLVHLERMRRAIEKSFPDARAFKRPGFDSADSGRPEA